MVDAGTSSGILDGLFRANPGYDFIAFADMTRAESETLGALRADGDCAGILRPARASGLRIKSVCHDTARLLTELKTPGPLPAQVRDELGRTGCEPLIGLLFDDVLQISRHGRFESGPLVSDLVRPVAAPPETSGYLAALAREALLFGQQLAIEDPQRLAAQMYFYHRTPVTPHWQRRIGEAEPFERFLGTDPHGRCGQLLHSGARKLPSTPQSQGWDIWAHLDDWHAHPPTNDYKLYVSPTLEAMPEALPLVVEVFLQAGVSMFKVGANLPGLTRPDKIVAYFSRFEQLAEVGAQLAERLVGIPVHGVPFTAQLDTAELGTAERCADGLLSWGMDPHEARMFEWIERTSWRVWIAHHLARSLIDARRIHDPTTVPWRFALERLRLDGIDPDTWVPTPAYREKLQR